MSTGMTYNSERFKGNYGRPWQQRVIVYGERNGDITEHELRDLVLTLESKGFEAYSVRTRPHRIIELFQDWKELLTQ